MGVLLLALATRSIAISPQNLPCGMKTKELANGFGFATDFCILDDLRSIVLTKSGQVFLLLNGIYEVEVLSVGEQIMYEGETGLLACAGDPDFSTNGWIYLGYSVAAPKKDVSRTVISRFTYNFEIERITPESEVIIVGACWNKYDCIEQNRPNHVLGSMEFGPDGYLYIAKGDGDEFEGENWAGNTDYDAPHRIDSYLGKILRVDKTTGFGASDNPYCKPGVARDSARCRVWATGLRNPWSYTFVPNSNNAMLAYDVGWFRTEAVKLLTKKTDGGWPCREGREVAYEPNSLSCNNKAPFFDRGTVAYEYQHAGQGASVIGGTFFRERFPTFYHDKVLLADYVLGTLFTLSFPSVETYAMRQRVAPRYMLERAEFGTFAMTVIKIKPGPAGTIWILGLDNNGYVRELSYDADAQCPGMELLPQKPIAPPPAPAPPSPMPVDPNCKPSWMPVIAAIPAGHQLTTITSVGYLPTLIGAWNGEYGPIERNSNVGGPNAKDGTPMTISGVRYTSGIGTRAPSTVRVILDGLCNEFSTTVGVDDVSGDGEAIVEIYGDGQVLASGWVGAGSPGISFVISVFGMQEISLVSRLSGSSGALDVNWAKPTLLCGERSPFLPKVNIRPASGNDINIVDVDQTVTFTGSAIDFNGQALDESAYEWSLNLVHCQGSVCHVHPGMAKASKSRIFSVTAYAHADCVSFEVKLRVKDSCGYANEATYNLRLSSAEWQCNPGSA